MLPSAIAACSYCINGISFLRVSFKLTLNRENKMKFLIEGNVITFFFLLIFKIKVCFLFFISLYGAFTFGVANNQCWWRKIQFQNLSMLFNNCIWNGIVARARIWTHERCMYSIWISIICLYREATHILIRKFESTEIQ